MTNPWDEIAHKRHRQLVRGEDVTFSEVLFPTVLRMLQEQEGYTAFEVLDVGCGTGFLTRLLSQYVRCIVAVDSSKVSIEIAQTFAEEKQNIIIECLRIEDYAKEHPYQFDFAIAHMSLQAIKDLDLALESIATSLKAGGGFLFSIPHPCFWALIKERIGEDDYKYHIPSSHRNTLRFNSNLEIQVPYFHRSLELYSSALRYAGFVIEQIIEPFLSDELIEKYRRPWVYPGFLIVLCRKTEDRRFYNER